MTSHYDRVDEALRMTRCLSMFMIVYPNKMFTQLTLMIQGLNCGYVSCVNPRIFSPDWWFYGLISHVSQQYDNGGIFQGLPHIRIRTATPRFPTSEQGMSGTQLQPPIRSSCDSQGCNDQRLGR